MTDGDSEARAMVERLVRMFGKAGAHDALDSMIQNLSVVELAALASHWEFWARPKQLPPEGKWRTWGFLTGRGFGKTLAVSNFVNREVMAGRAKLIGLAAQDEANCIAIQVKGPSGLIATAPPWFKPEWIASELQLVWPNGARAYVRTPEVPGKIRGLEYHLSWCTELQSWPVTTREDAWVNGFQVSTRLGYARIVWDATPKRRHPIIKELLSEAEANPEAHRIVRGSTFENRKNLAEGYVENLVTKWGGTQRGKEELEGQQLEDSESALVKQDWIDAVRRDMPDRLIRRVVAVDPAVTSRAGSDQTGIVEVGLTVDDQAVVLGDHTGKYTPPEWGKIVLDLYVRGECDLVLVETNKGGDLLTTNLRAIARERGLSVQVVDDRWYPHRQAGVVFVRERFGRGPKEDRARPLSTAYERGRVSHVRGVDLRALEDTLTTWEPTPGHRSPDRLDPLVYAVSELLSLSEHKVDARASFVGITTMAQALARPGAGGSMLAKLGARSSARI